MAYKRKPVKSPKLIGVTLRIFVALLENFCTGLILFPVLLRNTGITAFRRLGPECAPTPLPFGQRREKTAEAEGKGAEGVDSILDGPMVRPDAPESSFRFVSVVDYARAYRSGEWSVEETARKVVEGIEASNKGEFPLRGIIKYDVAEIERQAAESARRFREGNPRSVLEGVPVAIKDELDMIPYATQVGTSFLGEEAADVDATAVRRLREAGALLVGKTNMFEIGISPTGDNPIHGFARCPYNPGHDAGGSSGGSAVAVASGLVPLAIGADGGGSIRIPASNCGVTGLKPTFGRVSEFGAAPLCWSVAHIGPLGASALDTAIGYAVCAGVDPLDSHSLGQPPVHLQDYHCGDLSDLKIGVYRPWFEDAKPEIVEHGEKLIGFLERKGAAIREIIIDGLEEIRVAHAITILSEMATAMERYDAAHRKDFCLATRLNLALGRKFTARDYVLAQRTRTRAMAEWERVFSEVDVVVTPTTATEAPFLDPRSLVTGSSDLETLTELMRFVVCANLCGHPAISFPAGYTSEGLPIGMQAIARHWEEHLLLRLARVAETNVLQRKPRAYYGWEQGT